MMGRMGALVTLDVPDESPVRDLPWIITIGPLSEAEDWEPVVCGPYEHPHALALAESVVADEDLMAVVEPVRPHASVDQIREKVAAARAAAATAGEAAGSGTEYASAGAGTLQREGPAHIEPARPPTSEEIKAGFARIAARLSAGMAAP